MTDSDKTWLIGRLSQLIVTGEQIISTDTPAPVNVGRSNTVDADAFDQWHTESVALLRSEFGKNHPHYINFTDRCRTNYTYHARSGVAVLKGARSDLENQPPIKTADSTAQTSTGQAAAPVANATDAAGTPDKRLVFVVHGRNALARNAMFAFLRSLGLIPIEWETAVAWTGKASPYIGEILRGAFARTSAVVVILSGDDEARVRPQFRHSDESEALEPQPRLNVIFEAGMALGLHEDRTLLVELGRTREFSDITGRHVIRIDPSAPDFRQAIRSRLKEMGAEVSGHGTDWLREGDFKAALDASQSQPSSREGNPPVPVPPPTQELEKSSANGDEPDEPFSDGDQPRWVDLFAYFRRSDDNPASSKDDHIQLVIENVGSTPYADVRLNFLDPLLSADGVELSGKGEFARPIAILRPRETRTLRVDDAHALGLDWYIRSVRDSYRLELIGRQLPTNVEIRSAGSVSLSTVFTGERSGPWTDPAGTPVPVEDVAVTDVDPHPLNVAASSDDSGPKRTTS